MLTAIKNGITISNKNATKLMRVVVVYIELVISLSKASENPNEQSIKERGKKNNCGTQSKMHVRGWGLPLKDLFSFKDLHPQPLSLPL